ncbi:MAG: hypothetical protein WBV59_11900 [Anaerolineae bacterium]
MADLVDALVNNGDVAGVLDVLRDDPGALMNDVLRRREAHYAAVRDELVHVLTGLVAQRDSLLRIAETAQHLLNDVSALSATYAGDLLSRQLELAKTNGTIRSKD